MLSNIKLDALRTGAELTPFAQANFVRKKLATMLRSREAKHVDLLFAGYDGTNGEHAGPQLYFMDHLASMARVPFATQGYGGFFTLSILDRHYKPDLSLEEAIVLLKRCIAEVRLPVVLGGFLAARHILIRLTQHTARFFWVFVCGGRPFAF
jgi:20S proteasome subunit beta 4